METRHVIKNPAGRLPGQQLCLWCGGSISGSCPVTLDVRGRVTLFAKAHGRTWKHQLALLWGTGKEGGLLRQARNVIGPGNLHKITAVMLARA